mmetsp:Transcript_72261/g.203907  ORF Transcript_72261/g.203907 Transcript_72261/m.203907 type:complete len:97 (-) Transcript_72261:982-1272(-)
MMKRRYMVNRMINEASMTQRGCESRFVLERGRRAGVQEPARSDRDDDARPVATLVEASRELLRQRQPAAQAVPDASVGRRPTTPEQRDAAAEGASR